MTTPPDIAALRAVPAGFSTWLDACAAGFFPNNYHASKVVESEIRTLRDKLAKAEAERDQWLKELDECRDALHSLCAERDALRARVEKLAEALPPLMARVQDAWEDCDCTSPKHYGHDDDCELQQVMSEVVAARAALAALDAKAASQDEQGAVKSTEGPMTEREALKARVAELEIEVAILKGPHARKEQGPCA